MNKKPQSTDSKNIKENSATAKLMAHGKTTNILSSLFLLNAAQFLNLLNLLSQMVHKLED